MYSDFQEYMSAFKDQLLIVLVNRLGGKLELPVAEVDDTAQFMMQMETDQERGIFTFTVSKKQ